MLYARIILPLNLPPLSYGFDEQVVEKLRVGSTVMVELGARKLYEGVVLSITDQRPNYKRIKNIIKVTDSESCIDEHQIKLWEWISEYYMCSLGEVMRAALPSNFKIGAYTSDEFSSQQYKVPTVRTLSLHPSIKSAKELCDKLDTLKRAKKQLSTMLSIIDSVGEGALLSGAYAEFKPYDSHSVKELAVKGFLSIQEREIDNRVEAKADFVLPCLTQSQSEAYQKIEKGLESKDVVLLQGVTGSGKTEIYIKQISEKLAKGEDVLYLLPEIALTSQLITRLEDVFASRVTAYHSRFSLKQRAEVYRRVSKGGGNLVVGVRSSVFLPYKRLGLVIIDEEHENSFKQTDPAPYYNGRDTAIMLAHLHSAKVILGSATPSLESYVNSQSGKYAYVHLSERYQGASLPKIYLSDNLRAIKRGERHSHFNKLMLDKLAENLAKGSQSILFQNRRGFSPYIECPECGWTARCPHCNVTLTLHKGESKLKCHYCGYQVTVERLCPACKSGEPRTMGFGTEKIEEELLKFFPEARVARLDADTARNKREYEKIISDFEHHKTDILIGTQMITKGFDFEGVSLVGVLNADNLMNNPDFRASERAFQMITQVAGRAGRRSEDGEVIIQTSQIDSPLLSKILQGDYLSMVREESALRESFNYPPYCKIIEIRLKHKDKQLLWRAAMSLNASMREVFARRVIGPEAPAIDRIKEQYILGFMLKIERQASYQRAKNLLGELLQKLKAESEFKYVELTCNVDP